MRQKGALTCPHLIVAGRPSGRQNRPPEKLAEGGQKGGSSASPFLLADDLAEAGGRRVLETGFTRENLPPGQLAEAGGRVPGTPPSANPPPPNRWRMLAVGAWRTSRQGVRRAQKWQERLTKMVGLSDGVANAEWTLVIDLPWPPRELSPNARQHWSAAARARKAYRARCRAIAAGQGVGCLPGRKNGLAVHLTFHPPDKRGRDWDNMLASMKSGLDGVADAAGVDDKSWRLSIDVNEPVPGGAVRVQVTAR